MLPPDRLYPPIWSVGGRPDAADWVGNEVALGAVPPGALPLAAALSVPGAVGELRGALRALAVVARAGLVPSGLAVGELRGALRVLAVAARAGLVPSGQAVALLPGYPSAVPPDAAPFVQRLATVATAGPHWPCQGGPPAVAAQSVAGPHSQSPVVLQGVVAQAAVDFPDGSLRCAPRILD